MSEYRNLTDAEREALVSQGCVAENWDNVLVKHGFVPKYVRNVRFTGTVKLGCFNKIFTLAGGVTKRSGIYKAALHNVEARKSRAASRSCAPSTDPTRPPGSACVWANP